MNNVRLQAVNACNNLIHKLNTMNLKKEETISVDLIKEEIQVLRHFVGIMLCISDEGNPLFANLEDVDLIEVNE